MAKTYEEQIEELRSKAETGADWAHIALLEQRMMMEQSYE